MAKSKRQKQRLKEQAATRPVATTTAPRRQSITSAAQQAQRRQELLKWLGTGLLLAVFAVVALIAINSRDDNGSTGSNGNVATVVAVSNPIPEGVQMSGNVLGDPNAPVTVIEYGDYQCPFCKKFAIEDYPKLIKDYISKGQVKLEFRQFPVLASSSSGYDQNGESFQAAEAALCAQDQGKFWEMHDLLYENSVGEHVGSFTTDRLNRIAAMVPGLDTDTFTSCLASNAHAQDVLQQASQATASGVNSTPTFVVGDQTVPGANYDRLKSVIDDQLAGK